MKATSTPAEYQNRFEHLKMFYSCSLLLYLGRLRMKRTAGRVSVWGGMRIVQRDCVMRWLSKEGYGTEVAWQRRLNLVVLDHEPVT